MKILFFCNTYSQLINAVQIKTCDRKEDEVFVVLSDMSNEAERIYYRLKKINCFEGVFFLKTKINSTNFAKNLFDKSVELLNAVFDRNVDELTNEMPFDEFIFHNDDFMAWRLFGMLKKHNDDLLVSRMEEGILSYNRPFGKGLRDYFAYYGRRWLNKDTLWECTKRYYCYNPSVYSGCLEVAPISKISENSVYFNKLIDEIFFEESMQKVCNEKYIFFPSVLDFEGGSPVGELELAVRIANIVGYDNLIIKVHPRDNIERFIKMGFKIFENSAAPWEAIQLNGDYSDKIFLTVTSGSVLSINTVVERAPKTIFLYEMCDYKSNELAKETIFNLQQVLVDCESALGDVRVVQNIDELYAALEQ